MTFKRFGLNGAVLATSAFILAACAGSTGPNEDVAAPPQVDTVEEPVGGQPDAVNQPNVTEDDLSATTSTYGSADQEGLTMYAGADRVFFGYDSAELTADARTSLDRQIDWLKHYSNVKLVVEGHCDERGTREYNLALGERRATAVKNYLILNGVSSSRVRTISYGKERPEVVGNGESSWRLNRRGVLSVQ